MSTPLIQTYKELVQFFGSQTSAAAALGVEQPSVNAWLSGKAKMSADTAFRAQAETNGEFKAVDLRPSLKSSFKRLIA